MKFKNRILFIPFILVCLVLFLSNSGNAPDRNTGAPFDNLCSNCHGGGSFDGDIVITGFPSTILPNTTYGITYTVNATMGSPSVGGFQVVAVNASNVNSGDLAQVNSETGTSTSGGREYLDQRGVKAFVGNSVSWNFNWTSPNGPNGTVITLYYSANLANGTGGTGGDNIIFSSRSGTMMGGGNPLTVSITAKKNISCFGGMDGSATGTAAGGTSPYSYTWSNGEQTNQINGVSFGSYRLTVTDNVGATASTSVALTQPSQLNHVVQITRNVSCPDGRDGAVSTTASGGIQPYSIIYSSGSPNGLRAGQYTVTVFDANTCSSSSVFTITEPDTFTVTTPIFVNPKCPADSNGSIKIQVSGANPLYKYKWNTTDTSSLLTKLKVGNYKLTITDAKNCNIIKSYELKSIDSLAPFLITKDDTVYLNQERGIAVAQISNYIESLADNCDPNPIVQLNIDTFRCQHLGKLAYIMQATDASSNSIKDTFFITVFDTLKPKIHKWPDTTIFKCNVQVPVISATDNCSLIEFKKISGPDPGSIFPIGTTVMKYQAIDNSNNKSIDSFIVRIENPIKIEVDTSYFSLCTGDTLYQYIHLSNRNGLPYSVIYKSDTLNLIKDTLLIYSISKDDKILLNVFENSTCSLIYKDTIIYPGALIRLDSFTIFNETGAGLSNGKIVLHFNRIDSFVILNASTLERINTTGENLTAGNYLVKAYKSGCLFEFGPYTVKQITKSVDQYTLYVNIYPLPFTNYLQIECPSSDLVEYQILSLTSKIESKGHFFNKTTLETSKLEAGIYFVKLSTASNYRVLKIIKQ